MKNQFNYSNANYGSGGNITGYGGLDELVQNTAKSNFSPLAKAKQLTEDPSRSWMSRFLNPDGEIGNGEIFGTNPFGKMGMFGKDGFFGSANLSALGDTAKGAAALFDAYNANRQFGLDKEKFSFYKDGTTNQINNNVLQSNKEEGNKLAFDLNREAANIADGYVPPPNQYQGAYSATGFQTLGDTPKDESLYGPSSGLGSVTQKEYPRKALA